jgi:MoxR-like ATPase
MAPLPASIDATLELLATGDYVAERSLATAVFLALRMGRPPVLEGEAGVGERPSQQGVVFLQKLRTLDPFKAPGIAETIDWSRALIAPDRSALDPQAVDDALGVLLKHQDDVAGIRGGEDARLLADFSAH